MFKSWKMNKQCIKIQVILNKKTFTTALKPVAVSFKCLELQKTRGRWNSFLFHLTFLFKMEIMWESRSRGVCFWLKHIWGCAVLTLFPLKFFLRRTFHTIGIWHLGKKGDDSHDHSGRFAFAPLCPCYQPTLTVIWSARSFETCRLHFLFLLRTEILTQKRQLVTFSAQILDSKNVYKLDNLQVKKDTNSSKHRSRSKPNQEPGY